MKPTRALFSTFVPDAFREIAKIVSQRFGTELLAPPRAAGYLRDQGIAVQEVTGRVAYADAGDPHLHTATGEVIDLLFVNLPPPFPRPPGQMGFDLILAEMDPVGPGLLRAAIPRYEQTAIVMDLDDQSEVLSALMSVKDLDAPLLRKLARRAISRLAAYELPLLRELTSFDEEAIRQDVPEIVVPGYARLSRLESGTNKHQEAWLYAADDPPSGTLPKAMNFNPHRKARMTMARARSAALAMEILAEHQRPTALVMARGRPIRVVSASTLRAAVAQASEYVSPVLSGAVLAVNGDLDEALVRSLRNVPVDMLLAPSFDPDTIQDLTAREDLALVAVGGMFPPEISYPSIRIVPGGMLLEPRDARCANEVESGDRGVRPATPAEQRALVFAWAVAKYVPSDGVVIAKENAGVLETIGVGAGGTSRRMAIEMALSEAGAEAAGAVLASDGPIVRAADFERLAKTGITAVAHPGGPEDGNAFTTAGNPPIAIVTTNVSHLK
jgi:phosphoribosylaminoimidazolecarboxamide formyltransferase/IMP cyclohydrolase